MTDTPAPGDDPRQPPAPREAYGAIQSGKPPETAALLAAIVASSEDAIASKTLAGIVTFWNEAAERLFGFSAQEMVGQSILKIIPPELHHEEERILSELRQGNRIERYETVRMHKNGRRLHISLTISPIRDASGRIIGAAKIAHDVTQLREREAQLRQSAADREALLQSERAARSEAERLGRLKDEFLSTLSHELRTPLNAIQGWTQILRHHNASTEDFNRGLEAIERNVRAQTQIVNDLLDMSRIISGQVLLEVRPMNLQDVIHAALDTIRPSAQSKNIQVQTLLDSQVGPIRGDPNRMQQVMWNLLTNAVKFTPKGGRIRVALERVNSHVEVTVEDSGVGIDPEFLPFVFDRFRQADASIGRHYGGLGLGLSIVKSLVELHGGSVHAESLGVDQGATFTVALPLYHIRAGGRRTSEHVTAESLETGELPRLDNTRVLIVDDDLEGSAILARIMEARGASVRYVGSAQEALDLLMDDQFDILLSDIGMPGLDGYRFIQQVRGLDKEQARSIPAISITAYARAEDRKRALLSGYQMHLAKPIEAPELVAAIASFRALRH